MPATESSQLVVTGAPVVLRCTPFRFDQLAPFQPMQRLVERSVLHRERAGRAFANPAGYPVPVLRPPGQRLEDQDVESAFDQLETPHLAFHKTVRGPVLIGRSDGREGWVR